ncbi:unnamed protein product [Somion occarium]|uniref:Cytochrome b-c1 complex subunit 2, mitochondrial n=1 Tax=Somion occarium TaxID=3059160 RepID=A0ABP1CS50_9APHY
MFRTSAARRASRLARNFATVVDTAGVKVAAVDNGEATSAVTFLVKAGSRYQNKPGVAHALKNFAFKSTSKRSALGTIRESELYGGVLSSSLSREHLALTAEFLRGDEPFFVDVLSSFLTNAKFTRHELQEYVAPVCESEATAAAENPASRAVELAHILAFRQGLGAPLFSTADNHVTVDYIKDFASSAFTKDNVAVLGTGVSQETLSKLVEQSLGSLASSGSLSSPASTYFGGETRVDSHHGPQTVFIGFGKTGAFSPELAVLSSHLSPQPSLKWSKGLSPIVAEIPETASGQTTEDVKAAGKAAVAALKEAGNVKGEELKRAIAKAKFAIASSAEGRNGLIATLGPKVLSGAASTLEDTLSSLDKVQASALSQATASLLKTKPTYVAVGDISALPYADELGL